MDVITIHDARAQGFDWGNIASISAYHDRRIRELSGELKSLKAANDTERSPGKTRRVRGIEEAISYCTYMRGYFRQMAEQMGMPRKKQVEKTPRYDQREKRPAPNHAPHHKKGQHHDSRRPRR